MNNTSTICKHSRGLNQAGVWSCVKTKTFSLVFPGSRPRATRRSSAPPPFTHQLLGAGGEPGSPGRLPCPPSPRRLLILHLWSRHPPPPVGHHITERRPPSPLAPLPHPPTRLGDEDGLQRAGRKREEQCRPSQILLLVQTGASSPWLCGASPQRESCSDWGQNREDLLSWSRPPPQVRRL